MMKRAYAAAGAVIVLGVIIMASGLALFMAASSDYWNALPYGLAGDVAQLGKKVSEYQALMDLGILIIGVGLAVLAFALANDRPSQLQFREVPSHIPLEQYPQPPQPPQSP